VVLTGVGGFLVGRSQAEPDASQTRLHYHYGNRTALESAKKELLAAFDTRSKDSSSDGPLVLDNPATLESYGFSANSYHPASPHSIVVKVFSTEDVVCVVKIARKHKVPITPYSGGTSLEGHFGGVSTTHPSYIHSLTII
jgi:D-lactate dehydrogenase (cytochrome)